MAAPRTRQIVDAVVRHMFEVGQFRKINQFEPDRAPLQDGLTAAVWSQQLRPVPTQSGLAATTAKRLMNVRIYSGVSNATGPTDEIDPAIWDAVEDLFETWHDDFDFNGLIRNVDLLGMAGTPLQAIGGYIQLSGQQNRVVTIDLPLLINDAWPQGSG